MFIHYFTTALLIASSASAAAHNNTTTTATPTTLPSFGIGYTLKENGTVVIRGSTLAPGDPPLTTDGHTVSAATNGLVIDGTLATASPSTSTSTPVQTFTFDSETLTASEVSSGVWGIYTATLTAGGAAKTVLGEEVTAVESGLVVATAEPEATTTSSTGGAEKVRAGCWVALGVCLVVFSML